MSEVDTSPEMGRPGRSLEGRVAIVTGAGSAGDGIGNGRAAAIMLAEDGCSVVCVDRDLALAERTVSMIEAEGHGRAIAVLADVTSASDVEQLVARALATYHRIDILFNCVGVGGAPGTAVDVEMAAWARGLEINITSMVQVAKHVIPAMLRNERREGCRGVIINMGSVAGIRGGNPGLLYPTSKGAVVNMTRAMAFHHGADGIRVNCICPGLLYTPMLYAPGLSPESRAARKGRSLLKTEGNAWDVGATVRFLASDQARWITGLVMEVDAGATVAVGTDLPAGSQTTTQSTTTGVKG